MTIKAMFPLFFFTDQNHENIFAPNHPTLDGGLSTTTTTNASNVAQTAASAPSKPISPGDVSHTTAIADRPKIKSVSKKDGKYIKKSSLSTVLQTPAQVRKQIFGIRIV